jgi:hypothetical protein
MLPADNLPTKDNSLQLLDLFFKIFLAKVVGQAPHNSEQYTILIDYTARLRQAQTDSIYFAECCQAELVEDFRLNKVAPLLIA